MTRGRVLGFLIGVATLLPAIAACEADQREEIRDASAVAPLTRTEATAEVSSQPLTPVPLPDEALVYTVGSNPRSVVVLDATSIREYHRLPLPPDVRPQALRPSGELLFFRAVDSSAPNSYDGTPHTLVAFDVLTGRQREIATIDRYVPFGFALSPDGNFVAYSARHGEANGGDTRVEIRVLDLVTLSDRAVATFGGEAFEQFSGTATAVVWREDNWLSIVGAKQGGQPVGVALLNVADGAKVFGESGYGIASGLGVWMVYTDTNGVGSVYRDPQRVRIIDPLTNEEVNRLEDAEQCSWIIEWSPDDSELLIAQHSRISSPDGTSPCDVAHPTYVVLPADGSPPRAVPDPREVWTEWFGDRLVEVRCPDSRRVAREQSCPGGALFVNDQQVGSGDHIWVLGWIQP